MKSSQVADISYLVLKDWGRVWASLLHFYFRWCLCSQQNPPPAGSTLRAQLPLLLQISRGAGAGDVQDQGNPTEVHLLREVTLSQYPHNVGTGKDTEPSHDQRDSLARHHWVSGGLHKPLLQNP